MIPKFSRTLPLPFTLIGILAACFLVGCSRKNSQPSLVYWISDIDRDGNPDLVIGNTGAEDVRINVAPLLSDSSGDIRHLYVVDVLSHETTVLLRGTKFTESAQPNRFRDDQMLVVQLPHSRKINFASLLVEIKTVANSACIESVSPIRIRN